MFSQSEIVCGDPCLRFDQPEPPKVEAVATGDECPDLGMNEYQGGARRTAIYSGDVAVVYTSLGLAGEAGEVAEKVADLLFPDGPPSGWDEASMVVKEVHRALRGAAEAGRACETVKKKLRDKAGTLPQAVFDDLHTRVNRAWEALRASVPSEVTDNLWYNANLLADLNVDMADAGRQNLAKLKSRKERGVISGSGDSR